LDVTQTLDRCGLVVDQDVRLESTAKVADLDIRQVQDCARHATPGDRPALDLERLKLSAQCNGVFMNSGAPMSSSAS